MNEYSKDVRDIVIKASYATLSDLDDELLRVLIISNNVVVFTISRKPTSEQIDIFNKVINNFGFIDTTEKWFEPINFIESLELIEEEEQLENKHNVDFKLEVTDIKDGQYYIKLITDKRHFKVNPKSSLAQCVSFFVDRCKRNEKEDDEICDNDIAYANMVLDGCKSKLSKYYKIGNRVIDVYKEEKLRCKTNLMDRLQTISEWHSVLKHKNV